jgi:hypothetical protein
MLAAFPFHGDAILQQEGRSVAVTCKIDRVAWLDSPSWVGTFSAHQVGLTAGNAILELPGGELYSVVVEVRTIGGEGGSPAHQRGGLTLQGDQPLNQS